MKQIWQCGFCPTTGESSEIIEKHELTCSYNPNARKCKTCKFYYGYCLGGRNSKNVTSGKVVCPEWKLKLSEIVL